MRGRRRSELLRILISDIDLEGGTILIREKKRCRKQRTTRRAPLTPKLADVLQPVGTASWRGILVLS